MTAADLGAPVAAIVRRCGSPQRVASDNSGNHFVFSSDGGTVFADVVVDADSGLAHAIQLWGNAPETLVTDIAEHPRRFTLGATTLAQTDTDLAAATEYSFASTRVFGGPQRTVVVIFDRTTARLTSIAIGEMATLGRLGALPGRVNDPLMFGYVAPALKHAAAAPTDGTRTTIVRVDIDRTGIVRRVDVVVPSSDAAFDTTLATALGDDRYTPATLYGRAIGGSVYREIMH